MKSFEPHGFKAFSFRKTTVDNLRICGIVWNIVEVIAMLARERWNKIETLIREKGAVTTADLVERFDVSLETVRRDLLAMEQAGKLMRVHGGAVKKGDVIPFVELRQRNRAHGREKEELARNAMQFIREGDVIGIDAGSTAIAVAKEMRDRFSKLTVVTFSSDVFDILRENGGIDIILVGGRFMHAEIAFFGPLTQEVLKSIYVPKWFLFPAALSLEHGVCCDLEEHATLYRQITASAEQVYILADSSKFERKALLKLDDMKPAHIYVTDSGLSKELQKLYEENGIKVVVKESEKVQL
jgi:DeoR/GlpR family transcriptional regulator of sugar metabolism